MFWSGGGLRRVVRVIHYQQVRWKRKDGHRFHLKDRPPTKKQRKQYNRRKNEGKKHGAPGSKAGFRREAKERDIQNLLDPPPDPLELDQDVYTQDHALLDDLMGNVSASQPNPVPIYYGNRQRQFFNKVADQLEEFQRLSSSTEPTSGPPPSLPSDLDISLALRAFRDRNGTRRQPVGLVGALRHLVQDLQLPLSTFGENTYTTLLMCCRTPKEGRKVIELQLQNKHPISSYSWSIMVDLHSKIADWQGCIDTHEEMLKNGVAPTLASYTSLISACAATCRDGRVPHPIRAKAGEAAFENWQNLQIVGLEPDVMAYGAMLSVYAARGQAEKALDLIQEMPQRDVLPTSYTFRQGLLAVARSHALDIRYESADTPRFRRREQTTLHHGKLARQILILAESAGVPIDDGIVSALCQCAAVAGDMASAKAIYTASEIRRKLDHWRTTGSDEHLAQLRGEDPNRDSPQLQISQGDTSGGALVETAERNNEVTVRRRTRHEVFTEREYGKDSRVLSAVLLSCSKSVDHRSLGTMWQGRENEGYFCINSLRLIAEPRKPQYTDDEIPGQKITDALTWEGEHRDIEDPRKKFRGVYVDENVETSVEELDDTFSKYFINEEDGRKKEEFRKPAPEDIWDLKYGEQGTTEVNSHIAEITAGVPSDQRSLSIGTPANEKSSSHMHLDADATKWKTQTSTSGTIIGPEIVTVAHTMPKFQTDSTVPVSDAKANIETVNDMYFDYDTMKWKTKEAPPSSPWFSDEKGPIQIIQQRTRDVEVDEMSELSSDLESGSELVSDSSDDEYLSNGATEKETGLRADLPGDDQITEDMEMESMNAENQFGDGLDTDDVYFDEKTGGWKTRDGDDSNMVAFSSENTKSDTLQEDDPADFQAFYADLKRQAAEHGDEDVMEEEAKELYEMFGSSNIKDAESDSDLEDDEEFSLNNLQEMLEDDTVEEDDSEKNQLDTIEPPNEPSYDVVMKEEEEVDSELQELREMLPTFPESRLRKVRDVFDKSLGNPPMLELIPVVRETMPDYITASWLKKMGFLTAKFVVHKAAEEDKLDVHMLNGVLALYASSGNLDMAIEFHQTEFARYGLEPTVYSDRLVLQMLLKSNRFSRALEFKQIVEDDGRTIDIKGYASLIEYCGNRKQFGSGLLFVKECVAVHGEKPEEASLKRLRLLSRQANIVDECGLEELVGKDPLGEYYGPFIEAAHSFLFFAEWIRYGQAKLKREKSKWGKRDIKRVQNLLLKT